MNPDSSLSGGSIERNLLYFSNNPEFDPPHLNLSHVPM